MTPEQEKHFNHVAEDVKEIKHALVGNPLLSDGGLVGRIGLMEDRLTKVEDRISGVVVQQGNWKAFAGGVSAITAVAATFVGWIVNLIWFK